MSNRPAWPSLGQNRFGPYTTPSRQACLKSKPNLEEEKQMREATSTLLSNGGKLTHDQMVTTPPATATHRPVPHSEVIQAMRFRLWRKPRRPRHSSSTACYGRLGGNSTNTTTAKTSARFAERCRLLSAYNLPTGTKVWIITEGDRSATTLLLPSEY